MTWEQAGPAEKADLIRAAIADGAQSVSEVAARLGATRCAVMGACFRQGITLHGWRGGRRPLPDHPAAAHAAELVRGGFDKKGAIRLAAKHGARPAQVARALGVPLSTIVFHLRGAAP